MGDPQIVTKNGWFCWFPNGVQMKGCTHMVVNVTENRGFPKQHRSVVTWGGSVPLDQAATDFRCGSTISDDRGGDVDPQYNDLCQLNKSILMDIHGHPSTFTQRVNCGVKKWTVVNTKISHEFTSIHRHYQPLSTTIGPTFTTII